MICNLNEILKNALNEKYAIPQFNINNLEWTKYILEICNINKSPVILGVSEGALKYMGGYNVVYSVVSSLIKDLDIKVPVVLHLDHGKSIESCIKAINAGFTSVMIDASHLPIEENIKIVKEICDYALKHNVSVEAEIGNIGGNEEQIISDTNYAKLEECIKLCKETNITSLAPALGSVHGIYKGIPNLNYERMNEISKSLNIPLVLHGGSGLSDTDIKKAIEYGTTKINFNTELQTEWAKAVKEFINNNQNTYDPRKIISSGEENIKKYISTKLRLLGSCNKI